MPNKTYKEELEESFYKECGEWCSDPFDQIADWWLGKLESYADKRVEEDGKVIEDLMNKIDTLVGYVSEGKLPSQDIREGIGEEWKLYREEFNTKTLSDEVKEE
jgi:hypothetical protein